MLDWRAEGIFFGGGARFFSAWIWGGTISLEKVLGGHDFLFTITIQKKIYIIFFIYRYSGIIFCPFILFPDFPIILFPESGQYDVIVLHHDWWKS